MDIVTHGMMGLALAGPYLGEHPWGACGFVLGSVLPDLDAFSRCGGKSAFLRNHQGWTHSFLIILTGSILSYWGLRMVASEFSGAAIGFGLGALLHSFLDLTNTFGVRAFAPFSSRRYCWEWLFFIDAFIIGITVPTAVYVLLSISQPEGESKRVAMVYGIVLTGYVLGRGVMRWRIARRFPTGTESAIPSALWPWEYLLCLRSGNEIRHIRLNGITGNQRLMSVTEIHDEVAENYVAKVPEYRTMKELSPAYHVVEMTSDPDGIFIRCRDLRTVNFQTEFGVLEIRVGLDSEPRVVLFNV